MHKGGGVKNVSINQQSVPAIGMGSWHLGQGHHSTTEEIEALRAGIDLGLKVIDTAEMYGNGKSESLIGEALTDGYREKVFLVSKIYPWNANRMRFKRSIRNSLKRLGTDQLDLYLLHWRFGSILSEAVSGFERLKREGQIKAWGVSNFDVSDMQDLYKVKQGTQCATNQVFYNPAARGIEYDLLPFMSQHKLATMAYSPLGGSGTSLMGNSVISQIAANHQVSPATVLLAWAIRGGKVLAIPESGETAHVRENAKALDLELSDEDTALINREFPAPTHKVSLETR